MKIIKAFLIISILSILFAGIMQISFLSENAKFLLFISIIILWMIKKNFLKIRILFLKIGMKIQKTKMFFSKIGLRLINVKFRFSNIRLGKSDATPRYSSMSDSAPVVAPLDSLTDGYAFEAYIADLLLKNGYSKASPTQKSGDFGADVIAEKDGVRYAIQCKLYSQPVGNKAVGEILAGMQYYNCHVGVVATNNTFTKAAIEIAQKSNVLLWDRSVLLKMAPIPSPEHFNSYQSSYRLRHNLQSEECSDNELYLHAVECALEKGKVSIGSLQRELGIKFNCAFAIVEKMEKNGIIDCSDESTYRHTLISNEKWIEIKSGQNIS